MTTRYVTLALAAALVALGGATVHAENRKPVFQCGKDWITVKAADSQFVFATAEHGEIVTFRKTDVIQVTSTSIALRIGKAEGLFDVSPKMADQVRHCLTR